MDVEATSRQEIRGVKSVKMVPQAVKLPSTDSRPERRQEVCSAVDQK